MFTFTADEFWPCSACDRPIVPGDRLVYLETTSEPIHLSDLPEGTEVD